MSDPRVELVAAGYDAMVDAWEKWRDSGRDDALPLWHREFMALLPDGAGVVELGCGGGTQETKELSERFQVTGIDLSKEQLQRARHRVPRAEFVHADFTEIDFPHGSVDAVVAYYSFNHVPRDLLPGLLTRIFGWLAPGGLLMASFGTSDTENCWEDFVGAPSYFSSFPPDKTRTLVIQSGFHILRDEVVTLQEPEGDARFHWMLARRGNSER